MVCVHCHLLVCCGAANRQINDVDWSSRVNTTKLGKRICIHDEGTKRRMPERVVLPMAQVSQHSWCRSFTVENTLRLPWRLAVDFQSLFLFLFMEERVGETGARSSLTNKWIPFGDLLIRRLDKRYNIYTWLCCTSYRVCSTVFHLFFIL